MRSDDLASLVDLPGADLVAAGIDDLRAERETVAGVLVSMAAPRLRSAGLDVPAAIGSAGVQQHSHHLYALLAQTEPATAHRRFNALVGRIVSFARAAERATGG